MANFPFNYIFTRGLNFVIPPILFSRLNFRLPRLAGDGFYLFISIHFDYKSWKSIIFGILCCFLINFLSNSANNTDHPFVVWKSCQTHLFSILLEIKTNSARSIFLRLVQAFGARPPLVKTASKLGWAYFRSLKMSRSKCDYHIWTFIASSPYSAVGF